MMKRTFAEIVVSLLLAFSSANAQGTFNSGRNADIPNYRPNGGLPHWKSCLARVKAGTGSCTVLVIGESTPAGWGSSYQSSIGNYARASGWAAQIAALLYQSYGYETSYNAIMGAAATGISTATYAAYDPRVTFGTGWAFSAAQVVVGGNPFSQSTNAAATLDFNPTPSTQFPSVSTIQTDSADVYTLSYLLNNNSLSVGVNGGTALGTITDPGNGTINKTTMSATLGDNTWNFKCTTLGAGCYFQGVVLYNSAVSQVKVVNGGSAGSKIHDWVANLNGFNALQTIKVMQPDLVICQDAGNDAGAGTVIADYIADYEALISTVRGYGGDFLIVNSQPASPELVAYSTSQQYAAAGQTIATAMNVPILDWFQYLCGWNGSTCVKGGWTAGMAYGWNAETATNAADVAHQGPTAYAVLGMLVTQILTQ